MIMIFNSLSISFLTFTSVSTLIDVDVDGWSELHLLESSVDLSVEIIEELSHFVLWGVWKFELHVVDVCNNIVFSSESLLNVAHWNFLLSLGGLSNDTLAVLMELDDSLHHSSCFVQGAVVVVLRERVLLKELIFDDSSSFKDWLLILREGVLTDKLHDLSKLIFLL